MNVRRTGDAWLRPPLRLDESRTITDVAFPPVVAGGLVLVSRRGRSLDAFEEGSGVARWSVALGTATDPVAGAPLVVDDLVHLSARGELVSMHLSTGEVVNRTPAPALDLLDGAFVDGCIISYITDTRLVAWDIAGQRQRWSIERTFDPVPIAGHATLAVAAGSESITAYDVRTGQALWTTRLDAGEVIGALAIAPDGSVIAALSKTVIALDAATGAVQWSTATAVDRAGTMAVTDEGEIHLMDLARYERLCAATGVVLHHHALDRAALPAIRGSLGKLTTSRSHVFGADQRGPLLAVSRATGAVDWTWEDTRRRAASMAPVVSERRLYALALDGTLQSFIQTA